MRYEYNESDLNDFISINGFVTTRKGHEIQFRRCPYCNGGQHNDKYTFSINAEKGVFKCQRGSCGEQGHFVKLARDFGYELNIYDSKPEKEYKKYKVLESLPEDEVAKDFLQSRGISYKTGQKYYVRSTSDKGAVVWQHIDENNELQCIKYRAIQPKPGKSKEWFKANTKPILFGMYQCDFTDNQTVYITEGQIDCLSLAEIGIKNALSVPNGCSAFTWVQYCYEWIKSNVKKIIVFGDSERGEITLVKKLYEYFQYLDTEIYVIDTEAYFGCKDANEILCTYGREQLTDTAKHYHLYSGQIFRKLIDADGQASTSWRMKTGFPTLDRALHGVGGGQLGVVTGFTGQGKTTFVNQMVVKFFLQGKSVLMYTGETPTPKLLELLSKQCAGDETNLEHFVDEYGADQYYLKSNVFEAVKGTFSDKIQTISDTDLERSFSTTLPELEQEMTRRKFNVLVVDNLMTACEYGDNINAIQTEFVKALKRLSERQDMLVVLVAHPKKGETLNIDSVSGASEIVKMCDWCIGYQRDQLIDDGCVSRLLLFKNRDEGRLLVGKDAIQVEYNPKNKRVREYAGN